MEDKTQEFLNHLHEEKLRTQEARNTYALQKLAFVTGLLGIGSLKLTVGKFDFSYFLYLAPWVAIAFDLYIMSEDYSIKRIGAFLGTKGSTQAEKQWEQWLVNNRDPFAPLAMPTLTTLVFLGAVLIASQQPNVAQDPLFRIWAIVTGLPSWISFGVYHWLRKRVFKNAFRSQESFAGLSDIATAVKAADHQLTVAAFRKISQLFLECQSDPARLLEIEQASKEYSQREFFVCVNQQGQPVIQSEKVLEDFRKTVDRCPEYEFWFQEALLPDNRPTLLVARWLCHSVGFRHRVVHLFLDHPELKGYTLLQVRAFDKTEAPGRFDLPAAGHVSGIETLEAALRTELAEELGLEIAALNDFTQLGSYTYSDPSEHRNVEYRTVFYGRLSVADWLKVNADSSEVAAIVSIPLSKVHEMIVNLPESVASGLQGSFSLYLKHRIRQRE